jgi:hypothetical protein
MDTFNSVFQSPDNKEKIESILVSFLTNKDKNIAESYKEFEAIGQVVPSMNPLPEKKGSSDDQASSRSLCCVIRSHCGNYGDRGPGGDGLRATTRGWCGADHYVSEGRKHFHSGESDFLPSRERSRRGRPL